MRTCRMFLPISFLWLLALLVACGGPQPTPTTAVEGTRPASPVVPPPFPTQTPPPPQPPLPTPLPTEPALATPGAVPDLSTAYERIKTLPGFRYEGILKGRITGESPTYLRYVEEVDAQGNFHLLVYEEEGGLPILDLYYVQKHLYLGSEGTYIDIGVQEEGQVTAFYETYMIPFTLAFLGASDLEVVGQETVNGLLTTKYRASFDRWVQSYLQLQADVSYTAEGYIWVSEQYGAIVKSWIRAAWSAEGKEGEYEAETEISQVGQIAPIAPPR